MSDRTLQEISNYGLWGMTLQELTDVMRGLCAQLEKADSMTEAEEDKFMQRVEGVVERLDNDYGVVALRPEVPEETQKLFFTLAKVLLHPKHFAATV